MGNSTGKKTKNFLKRKISVIKNFIGKSKMPDPRMVLKSVISTLIIIALGAACLVFVIVKTSLKTLYKWPITALIFVTVLFLFDPNLFYTAAKTVRQNFVSDPASVLKSLSILFRFCIAITWLAIFIKEVATFDDRNL